MLASAPSLALCKDEIGWTPLHVAAQVGNNAVAELLLDSEALIERRRPIWLEGRGHFDVPLPPKHSRIAKTARRSD